MLNKKDTEEFSNSIYAKTINKEYTTPWSVANSKQEGGSHYKQYNNLQPWDVVLKWNLGYLEGTALKYIARHRDKNGVEDIKKAIHFLEKLVEEYNNIYDKNRPI